jgi:hypothetical protein
MPPGKTPPDAERKAQIQAALRRDHELRQQGYREQALKLFPHICARCGRELSGKRLRELTVHHKNHDHRHNPSDGSNWELLCLYCHDHEHEKYKMAGHYEGTEPEDRAPSPSIFQPFAGLDGLLGDDKPVAKK